MIELCVNKLGKQMNLKALFSPLKKDDIFNLLPDAVFVLESDGKIIDVNQKAVDLFGYSRFNMIGEYFSQYVQNGSTVLNKIVGLNISATEKINCASKEEKYIEMTAHQDAKTQKVYVSLREVTENYKKQVAKNGEFEVAKGIIDEKNNYLQSNSSEILSTLSSINSFAKAMLEGIAGDIESKQKKYISIINKNSADLYYNLEKLFQLFKMESDLYKYDYKSFDIINFLNTIGKNWEEKFSEKKIKFTYDFSQIALRNVNLDQNMLEYLLNGLLEASFKNIDVGTCSLNVGNPPLEFLKDKGIVVSQDSEIVKNWVMFEIKDTSNEISDEELANIFNPYYVIKNSQRRPMGTKCTYAIAKRIVKTFGGDMWIYSKPAQGTLVSFVVPIEKIS